MDSNSGSPVCLESALLYLLSHLSSPEKNLLILESGWAKKSHLLLQVQNLEYCLQVQILPLHFLLTFGSMMEGLAVLRGWRDIGAFRDTCHCGSLFCGSSKVILSGFFFSSLWLVASAWSRATWAYVICAGAVVSWEAVQLVGSSCRGAVGFQIDCRCKDKTGRQRQREMLSYVVLKNTGLLGVASFPVPILVPSQGKLLAFIAMRMSCWASARETPERGSLLKRACQQHSQHLGAGLPCWQKIQATKHSICDTSNSQSLFLSSLQIPSSLHRFFEQRIPGTFRRLVGVMRWQEPGCPSDCLEPKSLWNWKCRCGQPTNLFCLSYKDSEYEIGIKAKCWG